MRKFGNRTLFGRRVLITLGEFDLVVHLYIIKDFFQLRDIETKPSWSFSRLLLKDCRWRLNQWQLRCWRYLNRWILYHWLSQQHQLPTLVKNHYSPMYERYIVVRVLLDSSIKLHRLLSRPHAPECAHIVGPGLFIWSDPWNVYLWNASCLKLCISIMAALTNSSSGTLEIHRILATLNILRKWLVISPTIWVIVWH